MGQPGRQYNPNESKFGFQGYLKDNEIAGSGNSYTTYWRQYDPRLGRWWSLDPERKKYPAWSNYTSMDDNPILMIDKDGGQVVSTTIVVGGTVITVADALLISAGIVTTGIILHEAQDGTFRINKQTLDWFGSTSSYYRGDLEARTLEIDLQNELKEFNQNPNNFNNNPLWKLAVVTFTLGIIGDQMVSNKKEIERYKDKLDHATSEEKKTQYKKSIEALEQEQRKLREQKQAGKKLKKKLEKNVDDEPIEAETHKAEKDNTDVVIEKQEIGQEEK